MNASPLRITSRIRLAISVFLWLLLLFLLAIPVLSDRRLNAVIHSPFFLVPLGIVLLLLFISRSPFIIRLRAGISRTLPSLSMIFVVLFLFEVVLRLFNPLIFRHSEFIRDRELGVRAKPHFSFGTMRTNQLGYNDRDHEFEKPPGAFRIVMLGDSFSWSGWEKNYVRRLEGLLEGHIQPGEIEVINAGWPGMGPLDLKRLLELEGLRFDPDMVGLALFVGNDFFENFHRRTALRNGKLTHIPDPFFPEAGSRLRGFIKYLKRESYLLDLLRKVKTLLREIVEKKAEDTGADDTGLMSRKSYLEFEYYRTPLFKNRLTEKERDKINIVQDIVIQINRQLRERGVVFFLYIIPDEIQVNSILCREVMDLFQLDPGDYNFRQPQEIMTEFCRENGILVYDLLPDLLRAENDCPLYQLRDSHWNERGNSIAAESLANFLRDTVTISLPSLGETEDKEGIEYEK